MLPVRSHSVDHREHIRCQCPSQFAHDIMPSVFAIAAAEARNQTVSGVLM